MGFGQVRCMHVGLFPLVDCLGSVWLVATRSFRPYLGANEHVNDVCIGDGDDVVTLVNAGSNHRCAKAMERTGMQQCVEKRYWW